MTKFKNGQGALQAIDNDATAAAIQYLVVAAQWSTRQIMAHFEETYGLTEEKTLHKIKLAKIKLAVEALVKERDG